MMARQNLTPDDFIWVGEWRDMDNFGCKLCGFATVEGRASAIDHVMDVHFLATANAPQNATTQVLLVDSSGFPLTQFSKNAIRRFVEKSTVTEIRKIARNGSFAPAFLLEVEKARGDVARSSLIDTLEGLLPEPPEADEQEAEAETEAKADEGESDEQPNESEEG